MSTLLPDVLTGEIKVLALDAIELVPELYPRAKQDDAAIERYRAAAGRLPRIVVARGRVLVDGFHRREALKRENVTEVEVEDLGDLTDAEILRESIRRNSSHGQQLAQSDKKNLAGKLWLGAYAELKPAERTPIIAELLAVSERSVQTWTKDARQAEKDAMKARAWSLWLDCLSEREIAADLDVTQPTIGEWVKEKRKSADFFQPDPLPHGDVWAIQKASDAGDATWFGRMPGQIVENLLHLYTDLFETVVDPFAGGGTTIEVAKEMGRRVWASDLTPANELLPIHQHDITSGWPGDAPKKAKLILLDPPYATQAKGRYSKNPLDLGNMTYEAFLQSWAAVIAACVDHLEDSGVLAFIIGSTLVEKRQVNHADHMIPVCHTAGLKTRQRIIVPYTSEQLNGALIKNAREGRYLLATYRDLVVLER